MAKEETQAECYMQCWMFQSLCSVVAGVSAAKEIVVGNEEDYVTHNWLFFNCICKDVDIYLNDIISATSLTQWQFQL
jgi:hypothetical protein